MKLKGPPALGAAAASQIIRHRISENNYDFEILLSSRCSHEGVLRTMKLKGPPALGAAAPSLKLNIESVKITMILKFFQAHVARMKGCFAP